MFRFVKSIYSNIRVRLCFPSIRIFKNTLIYNSKFGYKNIIYENVFLLNVSIGDYTYVGGDSKIQNATIGKFCSIGPEVRIGLGKHPWNYKSTHPGFYAKSSEYYGFSPEYRNDEPEYENVEIGNDVWIGCRAMILDGVKIGTGAVIAAGAVVTKDVPPYAIVGGIPAKILKYRFSEGERTRLLDSRWWDDPKYNE